MIRARSILSKMLLLAVPLAAAILFGAPSTAQAQEVYPPDAYIAITPPEYYQGRPVYYYHNNWFYRGEHGRWNRYRSEPGYLRDRRTHGGAGHGGERGRYHR
jgi:hypothetical protein